MTRRKKMPDYNQQLIEIGEGDLTVQFAGEGAPVNIGYCRGAKFGYKLGITKVKAQFLDIVKIFQKDREINFEIEALENSARNLCIAMGLDVSIIDSTEAGKKKIQLPALTSNAPPFAEVKYKVADADDASKFYEIVLYKAQAGGELNLEFSGDKERTFKMMWTATPDPDNDNSPGELIVPEE